MHICQVSWRHGYFGTNHCINDRLAVLDPAITILSCLTRVPIYFTRAPVTHARGTPVVMMAGFRIRNRMHGRCFSLLGPTLFITNCLGQSQASMIATQSVKGNFPATNMVRLLAAGGIWCVATPFLWVFLYFEHRNNVTESQRTCTDKPTGTGGRTLSEYACSNRIRTLNSRGWRYRSWGGR